MSLRFLTPQPADPLLAMIAAFAQDPRPHRIDLSIGVYRDEAGRTPVLQAVKEAEQRLVEAQASKSYLGPEGDHAFVEALVPTVFGTAPGVFVEGLQTPGGTGALRVAAELLALGGQGRTVWLGLPTWSNHAPVLRAAGLALRTFPQVDVASQAFDLPATLAALEQARAGDVLVLQACCHNPTGIDPEPHEWRQVAECAARRGLIVLLDMAYQGLGEGLEEDATLLREFVARVPEVLVAYSCNKNFALYRDRVGAFFIASHSATCSANARSNALALVRAMWSMPPDHGAAVVRTILHDPRLEVLWRRELDAMRDRIAAVRGALGTHHAAPALSLGAIAGQKGMFATLPLSAEVITRLRGDHGVYLAPGGRANLAGLPLGAVDRFVAALEDVLACQAA